MAQISKLTIEKQSGSDNAHFAKWEFNEQAKNSTTITGAIKENDLVSIKSEATYYNGVQIPSWVKSDKWYVLEVSGDRAVLGKNATGTNNIMSPINVANLIGGSGSSSSTSPTISVATLDHYIVTWYYDTGDGVWFTGTKADVKVKNATYNAPKDTIRIKVTVKPVSKTHKVNKKDTSYWTGISVSVIYSTSSNPPAIPKMPTVKMEKYKLIASLENIADGRTDEIAFEVYNGSKSIKKAAVKVVTQRVAFSYTVAAGGEYRVRCRAVNLYGKTKIYSSWSDYSAVITTIPTVPVGIATCRASSATSIHIAWAKVNGAESYDLEYTTNKNYFDGSDQTKTVSGIQPNHYEKTGLESGKAYFFRVRAVNGKGKSAWSGIKSVTIGNKPAAPTTWSSTTTAIVGEKLLLYWVHNVEDESNMTYAEVEVSVDRHKETYTVTGSAVEEDKNKTYSYPFSTSIYNEGSNVRWRVRTAGVTKTYGDWSIQRTIDLYAPPTLELTVADQDGEQIDILKSFPLCVSGLAGPKTQAPIGYYLTITAGEIYKTTDRIGNAVVVNKDDAVYSKYFDTVSPLEVILSASDLNLENNVPYTLTCTVSMDSGLIAVAALEFTVSWVDSGHEPDAEISIDRDMLAVYVKPYCIDEDGFLIKDILLSVYRHEFDGSFIELAVDLNNAANITVTDPHPALDYARYRIVAVTISTGAVQYYDVPGYPINEKAIILQWAEDWRSLDTAGEDETEQPPWSGSLLKLPYNIDVSDDHQKEVSMIEYTGRKHPVSYYGTQLGITATWNVEILKQDIDTLYAIRRLAIWTGDVYVREPSGSGYWGNVSVSISQKHMELTVPVALSIVRVEGGV